jgi:hypothetical protein
MLDPIVPFGGDDDSQGDREKRQAGHMAEAQVSRKEIPHIGAEDAGKT